MRPLFGIGILVSVLLALIAGPVGVARAADPSRELIVRFDDDATAAGRLDAREDARTDFEHALPLQGMQLVSVDSGQSVAVARRALESDPDVLYAEPNAIRHASAIPNDPYFSQLWAMLNTGQSIRGVAGTPDADSDVAEAWDAGVTGGTIVAVLAPVSTRRTPTWRPTCCRATTTWTATTTRLDENGHGTRVALVGDDRPDAVLALHRLEGVVHLVE